VEGRSRVAGGHEQRIRELRVPTLADEQSQVGELVLSVQLREADAGNQPLRHIDHRTHVHRHRLALLEKLTQFSFVAAHKQRSHVV
jgi:hypothetical protein